MMRRIAGFRTRGSPLGTRAAIAIAALVGCAGPRSTGAGEAPPQPPLWAREAIWYQIFVERFRNGDPENDPTLEDIEGSWPHRKPASWSVTPWTHDWYARESWARATGEGFYRTVQMRRYGGDLQGILDRLDALHALGVTALYLNPINDSPSLHKYDARSYRHVDRNFGPDPAGDRAIAAREDPADARTWRWTSSDRLFLRLVEEIHRRGMRIIVDYSWNHTGATFWAWKDVVEKQAASRFAAWYEIERFDDPTTAENEFTYSGWAGVRELPELKKIRRPHPETGEPVPVDLHPEVKKHVFAVTRRWLDPDGDGDPSDGVDGFRLDVAEKVPIGFWRDYRRFVKAIHPDALLVAELWWKKWPDRLLDPAPWLQGDVFDAVMNYRWYVPARSFFAGTPPHETARSCADRLLGIEAGIPRGSLEAMMNVAATHDTPRLATSLYNRGRYKVGASPRGNPDYRVDRPDEETRARQRLLLVLQFTWRGAPHIFYGDEVGMWGADDPDCRKPMLWDDLTYESETGPPSARSTEPSPVAPDRELSRFYARLIRIRKQHSDVLSRGETRFLAAPEAGDVLAYLRSLDGRRVIVCLNRSGTDEQVALAVEAGGAFRDLLDGDTALTATGGHLVVPLSPLGARILVPR